MRTLVNVGFGVLVVVAFFVMLNGVLLTRQAQAAERCDGPFVCSVLLDASAVVDAR